MKAAKWIIGLLVIVGIIIYMNLPVNEEAVVSTIVEPKPKESVDGKFISVNEMTLEEKIGQILMPDFRTWNGFPVTAINNEIIKLIQDYHLGGVILFQENVKTFKQTQDLIKNLQEAADIPLMIGIDQEGGLVTRISYAPTMPGNMALGATGDPELARQAGIAIGSELRRLGVQLNFAPVLDVNSNRNNPVIGVRSFGDQPDKVIEMATSYMKGLNQSGVAAIGKHFPGHGDVDLDSHYVLPHSTKTLAELKEIELKPFQALIDKGIQGIMSAHITFNEIDKNFTVSKKDSLPIGMPATLSSYILTDLLRQQMKFEGIVFSDAMNMKAITSHFGPAEAAIRAVSAGADVVLMPYDMKLVYEGLLDAVKSGELSEDRVDEAVERILQMKQTVYFNKDEVFEEMSLSDAFKLEQQIANKSVTLVKNSGVIPLGKGADEKLIIVGEDEQLLTQFVNSLNPYQQQVDMVRIDKNKNYSGKLSKSQKQTISEGDKIFVVTESSGRLKTQQEWKYSAFRDVIDQGKPVIIVAARNPYDYQDFKDVDAFIAQYSSSDASFKATSAVLYGEIQAVGKLPVKVE
jgi:beta-N-acetylhexosaminidase